MPIKDIKGQKFGRLIVLQYVGNSKYRNSIWRCKCDCGNYKNVEGRNLCNGATQSCGCRKIESDKTRTMLPFGESVFNYLYDDIKRRSEKKEIECTLSTKQFKDIISRNCHYCGESPKEKNIPKSNGFFLANGIDRVDNSVGYIYDNCVPCCETCNMMKRTHSVEEWLSHMKKVLEYCNDSITEISNF